MNMLDIIDKTRKKVPLTASEIFFIIENYTQGSLPDYQIASWLMAVCIQGLSPENTAQLTQAMAESGKTLDWKYLQDPPVDKHSTGGVGDTTTLLLMPILYACGVPVAKMSGRGLGFTGGTLDKLEAIPGFQTILSENQFSKQLKNHHIAFTGQSPDLAPADAKLYALRDATGTVESLPLIASSIMSKKLAAGAEAIVLDVKVGSGGFMKNLADAQTLANLMVEIGYRNKRRISAYLTNMDQPLGNYVGNRLEVYETIQLLSGSNLNSDLAKVTVALAGELLFLSNKASTSAEGLEIAASHWKSGQALKKLEEWITLQNGDASIVHSPDQLCSSTYQEEVFATASGFISSFQVEGLGILARDLGAGRVRKDDLIDLQAGFILHKRLGEPIQKGEKWLTLHSSSPIQPHLIEKASQLLTISKNSVVLPPLIVDRISQK